MKTRHLLFIVFPLILGVVSSGGARPRPVEILAATQATGVFSVSRGPVPEIFSTVNLTANTLSVSLDALLQYGASGQRLATVFTVSIRVDGVAASSAPITSLDGGFIYQITPFYISATVNGLSKGNHYVDIYIDAGTETVSVFAPSYPATLTITQY